MAEAGSTHRDFRLDVSTLARRQWWANRVEHWRKGKQPRDAKLISGRKAKAGKRDIFVYFDNDAKVHAPFNAKTLAEKLKLQGAAI